VWVATADHLIPVSHPVVLHKGKIIREQEHICIHKGSFVHIPLEGINLSEDIRGSDTRQFKPPSFPGLANIMSFSIGPHSCPGFRSALAFLR
ncbi:hypothetical protein DFH07DRAFT_701399, partial [Mycena maculata]